MALRYDNLGDLHQQIGRLTSTSEAQEEALSVVRRQMNRTQAQREQLRAELVVSQTETNTAKAEVEQMVKLIKDKDHEIMVLDEKLKDFTDKVQRMGKTIRVQSTQISTPQKNGLTPLRAGNSRQSFQLDTPRGHQYMHMSQSAVFQRPPPAFNPINAQNPSFRPHFNREASSSLSNAALSIPTTTVPPVTNYGYNRPMQGSGRTQHSGQWPADTANGAHIQSTRGMLHRDQSNIQRQADMAHGMGALTVQSGEIDDFSVGTELSRLFKMSEDWARNYANAPSSADPVQLPSSLLTLLNGFCNNHSTMAILSTGNTRFFLVTRVINNYLNEEVLKIKVLRGRSGPDEDMLKAIRKHIQPGMPDHSKRGAMQASADTVKCMQGKPGFNDWLDSKARTMSASLHGILGPLLPPTIDQASTDLVYLVTHAFRISVKMHMRPMIYDISFPKVNQHAYFNPSTMLNRDPMITDDPLSIQRKQYRVRLVVSPIVVITDLLTPVLNPKTVHHAEVLLTKWYVLFSDILLID
ncbi:hypothetical protein MMC09_001929 [Bachmanniomyces sp. S44760]|nr:hypothetical protein [Bachmanniomyces sp. S44760]